MEGGPIGSRGRNAVSRVVVELETDLELAPILLHNMAAKNAVDQRRKCNLATNFHAQVKSPRFFPQCSVIRSFFFDNYQSFYGVKFHFCMSSFVFAAFSTLNELVHRQLMVNTPSGNLGNPVL